VSTRTGGTGGGDERTVSNTERPFIESVSTSPRPRNVITCSCGKTESVTTPSYRPIRTFDGATDYGNPKECRIRGFPPGRTTICINTYVLFTNVNNAVEITWETIRNTQSYVYRCTFRTDERPRTGAPRTNKYICLGAHARVSHTRYGGYRSGPVIILAKHGNYSDRRRPATVLLQRAHTHTHTITENYYCLK